MLSLLGNEVVLTERTMTEALIEGTSLKAPFPEHKKKNEFREIYARKGFICAVNETVGGEIEAAKKHNKLSHLKKKIKILINAVGNIYKKNG